MPGTQLEKPALNRSWFHSPFKFYIKKFKYNFLLGLVALLFTNAFDILGPFVIGKTIDSLGNENKSQIYIYLFMLLCVSVGTALFRFLWRIYFGRFHQAVAADLRNHLFKKMISLGLNYHQKNATGEKMTLLTQDIENFRMGIGPGILIFVDSLVYIFGLLPLMMYISIPWSLKCLALMPLIPFVIYKLENTFNLRYRKYQDETGDMASFAQETVSGIKVIKSLGLYKFRSLNFEKTNQKLEDYGIKVDQIESAFGPSLEFFVMIGTATLLFVGATDVVNGSISIGSFFAFYQYLLRMIWPMTALGFSFMMYKEADSSFNRIKNVLEKESWIQEGHLKTQTGQNLEVKHLNFVYPESKTHSLYDINFELKANESMAIVGPVGSGKTSLVQVLAKYIPYNKGSIQYGSTEIKDIKKSSFRNILTLIPQNIFLFKKTISQNLTDYKQIEENKLYSILSDVEILNEIKEMPLQLQTALQENGQGLSGGQRQRLTLARGLSFQPQWLCLDDSLSAVDIETEQKIVSRLKKLKAEKKMNFIFCSHRIQNLSWVDKILVLDAGKVVDLGKHEDLLLRCPLYKSLYTSTKQNDAPNEKKVLL